MILRTFCPFSCFHLLNICVCSKGSSPSVTFTKRKIATATTACSSNVEKPQDQPVLVIQSQGTPPGQTDDPQNFLHRERTAKNCYVGKTGIVLLRCDFLPNRTFMEKIGCPAVLRAARALKFFSVARSLSLTHGASYSEIEHFFCENSEKMRFQRQQAHAVMFRDHCPMKIHDRCPFLREKVLLYRSSKRSKSP